MITGLPFFMFGGMMLDAILHAVGFGLCHQLPERTLTAGAHLLPVCARDTGIYLGFVVSFLSAWLLDRGRCSAGGVGPLALVLAAVGFVAMAADGFLSYAGLRTTTNFIRLLTGVGAGSALGLVTLAVLLGQVWALPARTRVLDQGRDVAVWLSALAGTVAVAWSLLPLLGWLYPVLVTCAIVMTFAAVNAVFLAAVTPLGRRPGGVGSLLPLALAATVLAGIDLAAAAALKAALIAI